MAKKNRPQRPARSQGGAPSPSKENHARSDEVHEAPNGSRAGVDRFTLAVRVGSVLVLLALIAALIQSLRLVDRQLERLNAFADREDERSIAHQFWVVSQDESTIADRSEAFKQLVKAGNKEWRIAKLKNLKLEGIDLSGRELTGAYLEACKLANADLSGGKFFQCSFELTDLSKANLEVADVSESIFFKAIFSETNLRRVTAHNADFEQATMHKTNLQFCEFSESTFPMVELRECDLREASFIGCDLRNAKFIKCNLKNTVLPYREESYDGVDFTDSNWWAAQRMPRTVVERCKKLFPPSEKVSSTWRAEYKVWLEKEGGGI